MKKTGPPEDGHPGLKGSLKKPRNISIFYYTYIFIIYLILNNEKILSLFAGVDSCIVVESRRQSGHDNVGSFACRDNQGAGSHNQDR